MCVTPVTGSNGVRINRLNKSRFTGTVLSLLIHGGIMALLLFAVTTDNRESGESQAGLPGAMLLLPAVVSAGDTFPAETAPADNRTEPPAEPPVMPVTQAVMTPPPVPKKIRPAGQRKKQPVLKKNTGSGKGAEQHTPVNQQGNDRQLQAAEGSGSHSASARPAGHHSEDEVRRYREEIRRELHRHVYYPSQVRKRSVTVDLRVRISRSGGLHDPAVIHSSGNQILDKVALGAVGRYRTVGIPPRELGDSLTISLDFVQ